MPSPRTFVVPPKHFDPLTASPKALMQHGFPQRPSAEAPKALAQWNKYMAMYRDSEVEHAIPQFQPLPEGHNFRSARPSQAKQQVIVERLPIPPWPTVLGDYSGIVLFPDDLVNDPFQSVTSKWLVPNSHPNVNSDQIGPDTWLYCWVGLDGLTLLGGNPQDTTDLLAVGTATNFVQGARDCYFWYAFYLNSATSPSSAGRLSNMPVSPGDTVVVSACADESYQNLLVVFSNLTTHQYTSLPVAIPYEFLTLHKVFGSSVETMVSTNVLLLGTDDQGNPEWNTHLPRYGEVLFQDPLVVMKSGKQLLDFSSAYVLKMLDRYQKVISTAEVSDPNTFLVYYTGL